MENYSTKIQDGGRVVIPSEIRKHLGLGIGDTVRVGMLEGEVRITTPTAALARLQGLIKKHNTRKKGQSVVDELIAERRREAKKEL